MRSKSIDVLRATAAVAAALAIVAGARLVAQTNGTPEKFTAMAVNMGSRARGGAATVEIVVNRWSTQKDHDDLMNALEQKGPEKLLDTLQKMPRVGYFRTPNSIGYDLHYAHEDPLPDGGQRVVLVTDRYIRFWEAYNQTRSLEYPFTVIEIHTNADGVGEGKMSLATRIVADPKTHQVVLENWDTQPVFLQSLHSEPVRTASVR
jgi:hypothetical protein